MHRCLTLGENSLASAGTGTQSISQDAYHRVQFKLLVDLLIQYGASLTLTRWAAGALLERTVVICSLETKLCSASAHNGPITRITALVDPLQCRHQGPGRAEPKWTQQDSHNGR